MHDKEGKQKMKEKVLEILGVEINEEFFLKEPISSIYKPCKYRINDSLCMEIKQSQLPRPIEGGACKSELHR